MLFYHGYAVVPRKLISSNPGNAFKPRKCLQTPEMPSTPGNAFKPRKYLQTPEIAVDERRLAESAAEHERVSATCNNDVANAATNPLL